MSIIDTPDWQEITGWFGDPLVSADALAIGAGSHSDGPYDVGSYSSIVLAVKPTGGTIVVTVTQSIAGGPAALLSTGSYTVAAGATLFQSIVLQANRVTISLQGSAGGETVAYALYPTNTAVNTGTVTPATLNVQHNGTLVGAEPTVDFEDSTDSVWAVTNDGPNTRVQVSLASIASAAKLPLAAVQSITTATLTALSFAAAYAVNVGAVTFAARGAASTSIVIPAAGTYLLAGQVRFASSAAGFRQAILTVGGVAIDGGFDVAPSSDVTILGLHDLRTLAAGDLVGISVFQSSGGNLNVDAAGTFISATRVA